MNLVCIKGIVFSGKGEGSEFIRLPWVKKQINEKMNFIPYPGTLNVKLSEEGIRAKKLLRRANAVDIQPVAGFCPGKCYRAWLLDNVECAVVVPEVARYPSNVLEIVAPTSLRDKLNLRDGDEIEIKIAL